MSSAIAEPLQVDVDVDELQRGRVEPASGERVSTPGDGDRGGGGRDNSPPLGPDRSRGGGRPGRPPLWFRLLTCAIVLAVAAGLVVFVVLEAKRAERELQEGH